MIKSIIHWLKTKWWIIILGVITGIFLYSCGYTFLTDKTIYEEVTGIISSVKHTNSWEDYTTVYFNNGCNIRFSGDYNFEPSKTYKIRYETHTNLTGIKKIVSIEIIN